MNTIISYCLSNVDADTRRMLRASDLPIIEDHCLQRCGLCLLGPFLLLGDTLVPGESHDVILEQVCAIMMYNQKEHAE